jgi:hypothetical protein
VAAKAAAAPTPTTIITTTITTIITTIITTTITTIITTVITIIITTATIVTRYSRLTTATPTTIFRDATYATLLATPANRVTPPTAPDTRSDRAPPCQPTDDEDGKRIEALPAPNPQIS